jgi:hypothetical protein
MVGQQQGDITRSDLRRFATIARSPVERPAVAQLTFTRNVFTSPISSTAKIPADLAVNPALLSPEQVAALHRPDLELSAKKFGEYRNLANQQLKS